MLRHRQTPYQCMDGCTRTFCTSAPALRQHRLKRHADSLVEHRPSGGVDGGGCRSPSSTPTPSARAATPSPTKVATASLAVGQQQGEVDIEGAADESDLRRHSVTTMLLELPASATDGEKRKILDLYRICDDDE